MATKDVRLSLPNRHAGQLRVAREAKRFNVLSCGRRWGKTKFGLDLLTSHPRLGLLQGMPCAWGAPTFQILREVWREARELLDPITQRASDQEHRLELVGGGVLECWSLDGPNPMRSRKYGLVAIDEAAFVRDLANKWNKAIRPTLADYRGEAWFLSSPAGLGDYYDLWRRGQPGDIEYRPDWSSWMMGTATNPYISPEEIEDARRDTPPMEFRQEWLGEFVTEAGVMFDTSLIYRGEPPVIQRVFVGIDPAASAENPLDAKGRKRKADDFAMAAIGQDQAKRWWILDMSYGKWHPTQSVANVMAFLRKWQPTDAWMEMGPIGRTILPFIKNEMGRISEHYPLHEISHMGGKMAKNAPAGAVCNAKRMCVPADAPWWPDLRDELARFNGLDGNPDDLVDAIGIPIRMAQRVYPDQVPAEEQPAPAKRTADWFKERREAAKALRDAGRKSEGGPRSRIRRR